MTKVVSLCLGGERFTRPSGKFTGKRAKYPVCIHSPDSMVVADMAGQKKLFKTIVKNLTEAGILGVLDIYVLSTAAITIDRLMTMEKQINEDEELLLDSKFMSSKDKYMKDFFRICNELCLSPQARAKISIATVNGVKEGKKNPILDALLDDD